MSAIAGIYVTHKYKLSPYQIQDINEILGKIFDASAAYGQESYGTYHAKLSAGNMGSDLRFERFVSGQVTNTWATAATRCLMVNFAHGDDAQPVDHKGYAAMFTGKITNAKSLLGRQRAVLPDASAIAQLFKDTDFYTPEQSIVHLQGSVAFAALNQSSGHLLLYRDFQPLALYYDEQTGVYFFASHDSCVPKERLSRVKFPPNSFVSLKGGDIIDFPAIHLPQTNNKGAILFSGGTDSVLMATLAAEECRELVLLHCDFGQASFSQEKQACKSILAELQHMTPRCRFILEEVALDFLKEPIRKQETLSDEEEVLSRGKEEIEIPPPPARNLALLSFAASYCEKNDISNIYFGMNVEKVEERPGATLEFIENFNSTLQFSTVNRPQVKIPLACMTKRTIFARSLDLEAPIHLSWSCQKGGADHCGRCATCLTRQRAFADAGVEDETVYES